MTIHINNLRFTYPEHSSPILDIPSWQLEQGQGVFVYGPSGSGKSTLLNLLSGILLAQEGTLEVLGQELKSLSSAERDSFRAKRLGVIFQQFNLIPYLSVLENILLALNFANQERGLARFFGKQTKSEKVQTSSLTNQINTLLERLSLSTNLLERPAAQLSLGQQQRVAIVRALIHQPDILIADEPSSALDSDNRDEFIELFLQLAKENQSSVVFVSHDKALAPYFDNQVDLNVLNQATFAN